MPLPFNQGIDSSKFKRHIKVSLFSREKLRRMAALFFAKDRFCKTCASLDRLGTIS
jgi:hypothetical protein